MVKDGEKDAAEVLASKTAALFQKRSLPGSKTYIGRAEECRHLANIYPYWKTGYLRLAARYEYLAKQTS
jgi:hypothetical protein